jgi:aminoglycoside 3-N-acetyltransferase
MKLLRSIRILIPSSLLKIIRERKRKRFHDSLSQAKSKGNLIVASTLLSQLEKMGIEQGDSLLVHASLSKMGFIQDGPATVLDALFSAIGPNGTLLMPSSPVDGLQLSYVQEQPIFDVKLSPSKMGAITEKFRIMAGVRRSLHPTEPVCAFGPQAEFLTQGHFNQLTPYNSFSPFYRLCGLKGKILYVGVTLDNAGTSLHLLEDAVDFAYPVYHDTIFQLSVKDENGVLHHVKTKVHNPIYSKKRRCDELIPLFLNKKVCQKFILGNAECLLFDANLMFHTMKDAYESSGITMYTPKGIST